MALLGFAAGFLLDELIAKLAREPYERGDFDDDPDDIDAEVPAAAGISLNLASETGALDMPRALTTGSAYRRLVVLAVATVLFAIAGWRYDGETFAMIIVAMYLSALIVCTGTDVLAYRVPNVITYPAILAAIVIGTVAPDANRLEMFAGGLVTGGVFLAMSIVTRGGMGLGDVKLAFFTGFALGLALTIPALLITAIAGGIIAVLLMVTRIRDRRDPIPYAPFISIGAAYVMLAEGTAFISL
jgi:leader peptidase (prepilin peptidase)/N-methyltransferase